MATGDRPLHLFITLIVVFGAINLFMPYVNNMLNADTHFNNPGLDSLLGDCSYLTIAFQLVTIPFWTFGLPAFLNIIIIPFRIIMLVCGYYVITPTK